MKTIVFIFLIICSMYIFSCVNNDTATQDPNGGYKERSSDTGTTMPSSPDSKDRGAVAVDTIKNGQAIMSGATSDSAK